VFLEAVQTSPFSKEVVKNINIIMKLAALYIALVGFVFSQECSEECLAKQGDSNCDTECYTELCNYDGGDCSSQECSEGCLNSFKNNTICDQPCYNEACEYDAGDCSSQECSEGCLNSYKNNGVCEEACNNESCEFDGEDCKTCSEGCFNTYLGDGTCQTECLNSNCGWDSGDCGEECSEGCNISNLGNGVCEEACDNQACEFDLGDCVSKCQSRGCSTSMMGDGVCQTECNNQDCSFDKGDCYLRRLTPTTYIIREKNTTETEYEPDNYGRVAGVGLGVFLTILALFLGVLVCIIGAATPVFLVFLVIGVLLPVVTFIIVAFAPTKRDQEQKEDDRTDDYIIPRFIYLAIFILFALVAVVQVVNFFFGINLKTRRVDSTVKGAALADMDPFEEEPEEPEPRSLPPPP